MIDTPHVTVRGIKEEKLQSFANDLKKLVVECTGVKIEYVKIFYSPVKRVDAAEEVAVDIYWMPRPQEMCDRLANGITDFFKARGNDFVQVTFTEFKGSLFYENNVHY